MLRRAIVLIICAGNWVYGQSANSQPAFEVAAIKPSPPPQPGRMPMGMSPGPGDPSRVSIHFISLSSLLTLAYRIRPYQLSGPSWLDTERFDVVAKLPDGATREQVPLMLQSLLAERFLLTIHREKQEATVYELVVGKNGPKLQESAKNAEPKGAPEPLPPSPGPPKLDGDGFPVLPADRRVSTIMMNGRATMRYTGLTMTGFAAILSNQLRRPVTDATGLQAKYDVSLHWVNDGMGLSGAPLPPAPPGLPVGSTPGDDSGPTLFGALEAQLGLKLQQKKALIDMIVVDHIDKVPTEN